MKEEEFCEIIKKITEGTATDEELAWYNYWFNRYDATKNSPEALNSFNFQTKETELLEKIQIKISVYEQYAAKHRHSKIAIAVACILLILGSVLWLSNPWQKDQFQTDHTQYVLINKSTTEEIKPGSTKAILTLANGKKIALAKNDSGQIAIEKGVYIRKSATGKLIYEVSDAAALSADRNQPTCYNTIETPRGGQYQVELPDGTTVWLNAASSLRYPTTFNKTGRQVELQGEAFFDIAPSAFSAKYPFIVHTNGQQVEVMGTQFNINAYSNEENTVTTLINGKIKVSGAGTSLLLKPGQQTLLSADKQALVTQQADVEKAIAWKNGYFIFHRENIQSVMRQLARWYAVDVSFEKAPPNKDEYVGKLKRSSDIKNVLKILEITNLKYRIEGRKITILN